MSSAAPPIQVLAIGDELLRGETRDLNSGWIARKLSDGGRRLDRICVIPDDSSIIAQELSPGINIVTGGLGPTPDDVTRGAIAAALDLELVENRKALRFIRGRSDTPEHERMAMLPEGSEMLHNDVGVAPGFVIQQGDVTVAALPGPPPEMKSVFGEAEKTLDLRGTPGYTREFKIPGREGDLIPLIDELFDKFPDLTIGSYPGRDGVRLRISGDRGRVEEAAALVEEST